MKNVNKILLSAMIIPMLLLPIKALAGTITSYTVQSGDSLWKISTKTSVSIDYLKAVNNLNTLNMNNIYPGQILKLTPDIHNYIVKSGDTLWKIATANKLTVEYLKVLNKLNLNNINVGQVIKLRPDTITYTVMQGDTLYLLAKKFGSTVDVINSINNLTGTNLLVKQQLLIPYNSQLVKDVPSLAQVVQIAQSEQGKAYEWGAAGPNTFDCSGLVFYCYQKAGYKIQRDTAQNYYNTSTKTTTPEVGDLVFFGTVSNIYHIGIYIGEGLMINAPKSNDVVKIQSYSWSDFAGFGKYNEK